MGCPQLVLRDALSSRRPKSFPREKWTVKNLAFRTAVLVLSLALVTAMAFGQAETGTITGTVTDPSGAVVPNAAVTVSSPNTGATRNTNTTGTGLYAVPNLQPGVYDVNVKSSGFSEFKQRVTVTVGSRVSVDAKLNPTGASTVVEVTGAGAAQVNTESPTLSQVVSGNSIVELPTLTRNPYDLVSTSGMVSSDPNGSTGRGVGVAINGQRAASTNILLDGGENVNNFDATVGQNVPLDSVQEFRVSTNNFSAQYGRASGGIVNVATKAGTNALHGSLYEFYRGARFAANTPVNKANGLPRDNFVRNQPGYSVGGPIIKDKLFFFSSSEWIRVRSTQQKQYYVPTADFIGAANANTQSFFTAYGTLAAPISSTLSKDDIIAAGSATDLPGTPWGNLAGSFPVLGLVTLKVPQDVGGGTPQNTLENVDRVDLNVSDRTQLYGRYSLEKTTDFVGTVSDSPYAGFLTGQTVMNQNYMFNLTHMFGGSVVSQTKLVYNRLNNLQPINGAPTPTLFYRNRHTTIAGKDAYFPGYLPGSPGSGIPFGGPQNLYQFYQDLGWTHGNHNLRFGGNFEYMRDNRVFGAYEEAAEVLGSNVTTGLNNFLTGQLLSYQAAIDPKGKFGCPFNYTTDKYNTTDPNCQIALPASSPVFGRHNRFRDFALYGEDSWKVFPRFTLTLGLRYEYYGVQHNDNPALDSNFYFGSGNNFFQQYRNGSVQLAQKSPVGGLWEPDKNNLAPRLGFAWDMFGNGSWSLRGGYGIAYERNFGNVTFNVIQNPPNYFVAALSPSDVGGNLPVATANLGSFETATGTKPLIAPSLRHVSQNIRTAYSEMWNLALEHQLGTSTMVGFEYAGSRGLKLYSLETPNLIGGGIIYLGDPADPGCPTSPGCTRLNSTYGVSSYNRANRGFSNYNGFNVKLQSANLRSTGITFTANYTWSHAIDNLSSTFSDASTNYNVGLLDPFNPALDKGSADFDIRHRVVLSGIWSEPWFKNSNGFVKQALGGWELGPIFEYRTGTPFTAFDCTNGFSSCMRAEVPNAARSYANGGGAGAVISPNQYEYLYLPGAAPLVGSYFNPLTNTSDFGNCTTPGEGALHPCPFPSDMTHRNAFKGPNAYFTTLGIYKNFPITERMRVQFRGEFFNLLNHANNYIDASSLDVSGCIAPAAGNATSCVIPVTKADKRDVQLAVKFIF